MAAVCKRSKEIPVVVTILPAQAKEMAGKLGKSDFRASNGWWQGFRNRHGFVFSDVREQAGNVKEQSVTEWATKL